MFRTVTQQLSFLGGVMASVKQFGDTISQSYQRQVSPILQPDETFSAAALTFFQLTVTRLMEARGDLLLDAERVHREALRKLRRIRNLRDEQVTVLTQTLSQVRATFDGTHGKGTSDLFLGLESAIVRASPLVLLRYAREAIGVLSMMNFKLPDTALKSTVLAPSEYAQQIEPAMQALSLTMVELDEQIRLTEDAQKVRKSALDKSRRTIIYGSRLLEALYILAGDEFHAARLRPHIGRGAASIEDVLDSSDSGEPDGGEPDGGEPVGGGPIEGESSAEESSAEESSTEESSTEESSTEE